MEEIDYITNHYKGYQLDTIYFELSSVDMDLLDVCIWMLDNRSSIRITAFNWGMSKSTLHRHIHTKLRSISFELYQCVKQLLRYNQLHRR